jgi:enhancing lycopene biosynthesis protein 2
MLERARYFSEHAKNAQRDYLNFLNNKENEGFQEKSAAQAIEMEKANVGIETAREHQAQAEFVAAMNSAELANIILSNAQGRLNAYKEFDRIADKEAEGSIFRSILSGIGSIGSGAMSGGGKGAGCNCVYGNVARVVYSRTFPSLTTP